MIQEKTIAGNQKGNLLIHRVLRKHFDERSIPTGKVEVRYLIVFHNDELLLYVFNKEQSHLFAYKALMQWLKADELPNYGGGDLLFIVPKDKADKTLRLMFTGYAEHIGPPVTEKAVLLACAFWPAAEVSVHGGIDIHSLSLSTVKKMIEKQNDNLHKAMEVEVM